MMTITPEFSAHFLEVHIKKTEGEKFTGDRIRFLMLSLPLSVRDLIAPEVQTYIFFAYSIIILNVFNVYNVVYLIYTVYIPVYGTEQHDQGCSAWLIPQQAAPSCRSQQRDCRCAGSSPGVEYADMSGAANLPVESRAILL
jgi:hypothetical protein